MQSDVMLIFTVYTIKNHGSTVMALLTADLCAYRAQTQSFYVPFRNHVIWLGLRHGLLQPN